MRRAPGRKRKLKDGTVVYDVSYRDSFGRKRSTTFYSASEARAFRAKKTLEKRSGGVVNDVKFRDFARRYQEFSAVSQRERTIRHADSYLRVHLLPKFGDVWMSKITREMVEDFLVEMRERRHPKTGARRYGPYTLRNALKRLNVILNAAVDRRIIEANPAGRVSKTFRPVEDAPEVERSMSDRSLLKFLRCMRETHPHCYPLFLLMARTGLRPSEAVALEWSAIDLYRGVLVVRQSLGPSPAFEVQRTKTKKSDHRVVDMSDQLIRVMTEWRRASLRGDLASGRRQDFVFPEHAGKHASREMKKVLDKTGLPRHYTPMSMRHSYARLSLEKGIRLEDLQRRMGHQDVSVTTGVYGRHADLSGRGEVNKLDQEMLDDNNLAVLHLSS